MKKILIITYYWPPKGGVGVQRWLKLTKYLCLNDYKPIIYTPSNGVSPLQDDTLLKSISSDLTILKKAIFEPQKLLSFFFKDKPKSDVLIKKNNSFFARILIWLRANFLIPDSRSFWIKPSVRFLKNYLKKQPVDVVISTGPPHSMHMIALALKKSHPNIKWIADFRDPWTDIEYFDQLPLLSFVKKKHYQFEKRVVANADLILSVSPSWVRAFNDMGAKKTAVLTNGYDVDDYLQDNLTQKIQSNQFVIGHFGLYNQLRDHSFFWNTLHNITSHDKEFLNHLNFLFSGEVHDDFFSNIKKYKWEEKLIHYPYLNHSDAIRHMMKCDLLLVTQGDTKSVKGRLPAKFFEYLGAKKPILAIGKKNSDLEKIISSISYAWFVDFNNAELLYDTILKIYKMRKVQDSFNDDVSFFSRENQVKQLIQLINNL